MTNAGSTVASMIVRSQDAKGRIHNSSLIVTKCCRFCPEEVKSIRFDGLSCGFSCDFAAKQHKNNKVNI
jgi:hypothetical protein